MSEESHAELQITGPPRFQFVRVLGRGVLGETHEVIDEVRGEPVVLKIFLRCRPRNIDQFKLEFESLARLDHPSLVRFHHLVDPASDTNVELENRLGAAGLAFTQEYIDGVDLLTWLNRPASEGDLATLETRRTPTTGEVQLPAEELTISEADSLDTGAVLPSTGEISSGVDIASSIVEELAASSEVAKKPPLDLILLRLERVVPQIVEGLTYLHRFQKVHGFLRPSNILVTKGGLCKLTDYGIVPNLVYRARDIDTSNDEISLLCAPEQLPYVAPELDSEATIAGDLYALGTVLFEAVAGYPPADAMEFVRGRRLEVPPLAELVPACPAVWAERIDALLRSNPSERPTLAAIGHVMGGEGRAVQLPPSVIPEPEGFVGQAKLLSQLRAEAHDVAEDETMRLVLLEGEAGVGKSLVIEEFAHWLSRRGWLVISGRCFNRESVPLQGWHQISSRLAAVLDGLPGNLQDAIAADRRLAAVLFPELAREEPPEVEVGRLAAIRALRRVLGFVSQQRPILLFLEDLHWASWDTAALLMDLFSESASVRCLIVGSWRTDSPRSGDHFLTRDLELSLVEVRRLAVSGFTTDEAREFLITHAPRADLDDLRKILRAGRSNPRILGELVWELDHESLDELDLTTRRGIELLPELFRGRMTDLDKRAEAMVDLLAVASGPIDHGWLVRACGAELSGSVLPSEQTLESIEHAFSQVEERRLVRRSETAEHRVEWVVADDACREVILARLSDRDRARLAGRIADAIGDERIDRHDLRFEYELRASRVAKAIKAAVRAARAAEARFAYHRSAKLWRWLLENQDKLDDPTVNPGAELARVEHLAGQHADAAKLYQSWAEATTDRLRRAKIRGDEAAAWLQAGDSDSAVGALDAAFRDFGQTYMSKWHGALSETPRRLVATLVRWNERLADRVKPGAAERGELVLAGLYDFALEYNEWLDSSRAPEIEARLARLANSADDALILGLHRVRLAVLHAGDGIVSRRDRAFSWIDEAERIIVTLDDPRRLAQVHLNRAILQIRYGEFNEARSSLERLMKLNEKAEEAQRTDRRWSLYWRSVLELRSGHLDAAESLARQLLHTYRGDRLAASKAYALLTEIALLRGEAPIAALFLDAGQSAVTAPTTSAAGATWYLPQAQLHIALGRPEVAVGQLQVRTDALADSPFSGDAAAELPLYLGMGHAASALAELQRVLAEPRQDATRALLRNVQGHLEPHLRELSGRRRSEVLRLLARIAMVSGKPRKALKHAEAAIQALGVLDAPIDMAKCMEARGQVLLRLERPEARGIIDQAWELYRHYKVSFPLVLEGWPVPREAAMLKED